MQCLPSKMVKNMKERQTHAPHPQNIKTSWFYNFCIIPLYDKAEELIFNSYQAVTIIATTKGHTRHMRRPRSLYTLHNTDLKYWSHYKLQKMWSLRQVAIYAPGLKKKWLIDKLLAGKFLRRGLDTEILENHALQGNYYFFLDVLMLSDWNSVELAAPANCSFIILWREIRKGLA